MLSRFSVKKPLTVFVAVVIVLIFGVVSFSKMTPDLFPSIDAPVVVCMTACPGASPQEAEVQVTKPMEQQLATLANLKDINSQSGDNYSLIQMTFADDVNMDAVTIDIREKIDQIESALPEMCETPVVMKMSMDMMPTIVAAVSMGDKSEAEISKLVEDDLLTPLKGIEGVASVTPIGMVDSDIQVVLSQKKIDQINDNVSNKIAAQFNSGINKINKGMSKAKKGKKQIEEGKQKITDAHDAATKKLEETKVKLNDSKSDLKNQIGKLTELDKLYQSYKEAGNVMGMQTIEAQLRAIGLTADSLPATINEMNGQLASINKALAGLGSQEEGLTFNLSNQYAELTGAKAGIESSISQLQQTLEEVKNQKEDALKNADLSKVLNMNSISAILTAQNFSMPAGYVTDGKSEVLVSVGDKIRDADELENLILFDPGIKGVDPVRLSDVGTVMYSSGDKANYSKINGKNGVCLMLTKQSTYATADVSENINNTFDKLESKYKGLEFTNLYDGGDYIHLVINSVLKNLLLGAILAMIILFIFLRDIRPTLITAVSIPLSVVFAVVLMYFSGVTLNMISLSGLAIGVGMLVDNSIVVIENIFRLRSLGYSRIQSAVSGAVQVSGAITASTLTTVCVFVPIIFIDGITRDIFQDLALTVGYSLLASLIIALTLVPAMAKGMLKGNGEKAMLRPESKPIAIYKKCAAWALCHKKITIGVAILLLVASSGFAFTRGFEFMPSMSTPQISADITMPDDSTIEETSDACDDISKQLRNIDGVTDVGLMLSSSTLGMFGMDDISDNVTAVSMYILLDEKKLDNTPQIVKKCEELSAKYNCEIITSADMDMTSLMGGSNISMTLYAEDLDKLRTAAGNIEHEMSNMKGLEDVSDVDKDSTDELHIVVNKNKAMLEGLTVAQVYQAVQEKLSKETTATSLTRSGSEVNVKIENTTKNNFTKSDLEKLKITSTNQSTGETKKVKLTDIARINPDASMSEIFHNNQKRSLTITASVKDGYNITKMTSKVKSMISDKDLVKGEVEIDYGGQNEEIMHSMKQMALMLLVGFILIYLIMVAQFQSFRSPFIVIFTVPLAFTGGMLGLLITGKLVSVISMMGFVMLMGVVVNNAIVLVDTINRFRLNGMDINEAVISAGAVRMRPVIMTAITTVLGLVPLAIGLGTGAEMVSPVAIVCIGGLIYATLTTLVVIPVMYKLFARKHMEKIKEEELEIVEV